jgi:hypothetical protein
MSHDRLRVSLALLCEVSRINELGAGSVAGFGDLRMTAFDAIQRSAHFVGYDGPGVTLASQG